MKKIIMSKKYYLLVALLLIIITSGFKCGGPPEGLTIGAPKPVTLNYWKVFEESFNMSELIGLYQQIYPHVTINYRNLTAEEYEDELIKSFAEDRGPDIFSIHTTWIGEYKNLIQPLPNSISVPIAVQKGTIKKETFTELQQKKTLTLRDMKILFPDIVTDNQVINTQVYGLPLSIDTLVLFYNRDLLNNAGIPIPAQNWNQFRDQVVQLTSQDFQGNIIQSGAAIGTADNIDRSIDILSLLMMQNGTIMTDDRGFATFSKVPPGFTRGVQPAVEALNFYNSFALPSKQVYTWNNFMPSSLEAFMAGKTAFFFGYSYHIPIIKAQAPKLNFEVTQAPQIGNPVNVANYWVETVAKKSKHIDEAWNFILFITTNQEANKLFLAKSRKPTALRALIKEQSDDLDLAPFANQLLTAKSWYKGKDAQAAEEIFKTMIRDNLTGILTTEKIIGLGNSRINQTY